MNGKNVNLPGADTRESSPDLPACTDVLIVGAGPTGLALAIALAKAGVNHLIIDKLEAGQNTSRAAVVHAHTLEALAPLGVSDKLAARGIRVKHFALRDGEETLVRLGFEKLPTPFAFLLMIPQDVTEACLAERLEELGGWIRRGVVAQGFDVCPDYARAWVNVGGVIALAHHVGVVDEHGQDLAGGLRVHLGGRGADIGVVSRDVVLAVEEPVDAEADANLGDDAGEGDQ